MEARGERGGARRVLGYLVFTVAVAAVLGLGLFDTGRLMAVTRQSDLVLHAVAFGLLGGLGRLLWPARTVFLGLVALIVGLELAQTLSPWHEAGFFDVLAGTAGAGLAIWTIGAVLRYASHRARRAAE